MKLVGLDPSECTLSEQITFFFSASLSQVLWIRHIHNWM